MNLHIEYEQDRRWALVGPSGWIAWSIRLWVVV